MAQTRRIRVKGVKKREISTDELAYLYFLMGKAALRKRRAQAADEKAKRREKRS